MREGSLLNNSGELVPASKKERVCQRERGREGKRKKMPFKVPLLLLLHVLTFLTEMFHLQ